MAVRRYVSPEELHEIMLRGYKSNHPVTGGYIYSAENWPKSDYSEASRTYLFDCFNKAFNPSAGGYSIFAYNADHTDMGVRIEHLDWKIEKAFIIDGLDVQSVFDRNLEMEE